MVDTKIGDIKLRALTVADVTFTLECLCEDIPIEGNASAVDPATDRTTEEWIREQLAAGNEWAWCTAKVTCQWDAFSAVKYLGCCSYESEEAFRNDPYFSDLCAEALDALNEKIANTHTHLHTLAEIAAPIPTYAQIVNAARVTLTRHSGARKIQEIFSWDPDATLQGDAATIEAGETVRVLHVRDMRDAGNTEAFGEFKALIYTPDYRAAWVMPYQIAVESEGPTLNGARVVYSEDGSTIYIPLPRELWRPSNGGCICRYCSDDPNVSKPSFWDTLAVSSKPRKGLKTDTTWTVHKPELHGIEPKRSRT